MVTLGWVTDQIKMQWARVKISVVIGFSSVPRRGSRCLIERRPVLYPVVFVGDTCHHIEELVHTSRCYQITIQSKHSIPITHLAGGVDEYLQFLHSTSRLQPVQACFVAFFSYTSKSGNCSSRGPDLSGAFALFAPT